MNKLFLIQLITSFIVGGSFIALLSFIAERVNSKISGLVIAFPSTSAIGFFFLGWAVSSEAVAKVIPASFIAFGLGVIFPVFYIYIANFCADLIKNKLGQIIISFTTSVTLWLILCLTIIKLQFSNLIIGIIIYSILAILAHFLLRIKNYNKPVSLVYALNQKIGRALFAGFIIMLVVFLGKTLNPLWAGVFSMFPAAFSSSLIILHWYYEPKFLFPTFQRAPIGSMSIFIYMLTVLLTFPTAGFILGTIISYTVSIIFIMLILKIQKTPIHAHTNTR